MTVERRALLDGDGNVVNVIKYDTESEYTPPDGLTLHPSEDADAKIGVSAWDGAAFQSTVPVLTVDPASIPPDDTTAATVTLDVPYGHEGDVTFDVNGVDVDVTPVGGVATVEVTATVGPDTLTVSALGRTVQIEVTE